MANAGWRERVERLEDFVGAPQSDDAVALAVQCSRLDLELNELRQQYLENVTTTNQKFLDLVDDYTKLVESLGEKNRDLEAELAILKRVLGGGPCVTDAPTKIRVPELKAFYGSQDAKELENFLWDME